MIDWHFVVSALGLLVGAAATVIQSLTLFVVKDLRDRVSRLEDHQMEARS